jgi:hypothetical protein
MANIAGRTMVLPPGRTARQLSARQLSRNNQRYLNDKSGARQSLSAPIDASSAHCIGGPAIALNWKRP